MQNAQCLFCKIAAGVIPSQKVYEDEAVLVFRDIEPKAPVHLLAIPKEHYAGVHDIASDQMPVMTRLFEAVKKTVDQLDPASRGYRLVINSGADGGQAVGHLHVHILAGRKLSWPPG